MKQNDLIGPPFVEALPNYRFVDTDGKPTTLVDFTVPTDGLEAPWGMAQLVFMHDTEWLAEPPRTLAALAEGAAGGEIRFTYPRPPAFMGTTFLKQALITLAEDPGILQRPRVGGRRGGGDRRRSGPSWTTCTRISGATAGPFRPTARR